MDSTLNINEEENLKEQFETKFIPLLVELQSKRESLQESRKHLNNLLSKQQQLQNELINEKLKNANDLNQSILLANANEALEAERQKLSKELVAYKIRHDLVFSELKPLREELQSQTLENYNLKIKIEELENKQKCHVMYQNEISDQISKFKYMFNETNEAMKKLRNQQENLMKIEESIQKNHHLLSTVKQSEQLRLNSEIQRDEMEKKLIAATAELQKLQQLLQNIPINQNNNENELSKFWENTASYYQQQLFQQKEINATLEDTIKIMKENDKLTHEELINKDEKIKMMESQFNSEKRNIEIQTDNFE